MKMPALQSTLRIRIELAGRTSTILSSSVEYQWVGAVRLRFGRLGVGQDCQIQKGVEEFVRRTPVAIAARTHLRAVA